MMSVYANAPILLYRAAATSPSSAPAMTSRLNARAKSRPAAADHSAPANIFALRLSVK